MTKDFIFRYIGCFCNGLKKGILCCKIAVKREHLFLSIVFMSVICITIHVDGKIGDHEKISVNIDWL